MATISIQDSSRLDLLKRCRYLVVSGGAGKGIAMCNVISHLIMIKKNMFHLNFQEQILGAAGTSIGAVLALAVLVAKDWSIVERVTQTEKIWDGTSIFSDVDITGLFVGKGLCSHKPLQNTLSIWFEMLELPWNITFAELYERTHKTFICNAACVSDASTLLMSHTTTPKLLLRDGICMSMCLPFLFKPFIYEDKEYIDGAIYNNFVCSEFPHETTMGIRIAHQSVSIKDMVGIPWIIYIVNNIVEQNEKLRMQSLPDYQNGIINVYTPGVRAMSISMDKNVINQLWTFGKWSSLFFFMKNKFTSWLVQLYFHHYLAPKHDLNQKKVEEGKIEGGDEKGPGADVEKGTSSE